MTTLEKVILGGYYPQALKGAPENVEVVKAFRTDSGGAEPQLGYSYTIDSAEFRTLVHRVSKLSPLKIASFQGAYAYTHDKPFVINAIQDDPRLLTDYPQPTPLDKLPNLTFKALRLSSGDRFPHRVDVAYGDFTLAGPKVESLKPVPAGVSRLAYDPVGDRYFGVAGHDVVTWKSGDKATSKMDLGFDVPQLHWPADVAFDTQRRRLFLSSAGYLYACDVVTDKWSALAERPELTAFTYHPKHDVLYGIALLHGEHGDRPVLRQFNVAGARVKSTPLGDPMIPGTLGRGPGVSGVQIVPADDHLVVLVAPHGHRGEEVEPRTSCIYLVDPKQGKVWLTAKEILPAVKE